MDYPLDKSEFIAWAMDQRQDQLVKLKLELLATQADLQIQLENTPMRLNPGWLEKAQIKLRMTELRLDVVDMLLTQQETAAMAFQRAAQQLLDKDVYDTIVEAANLTSASHVTRVS